MNLKELANSLKLSQTTVSRALNGYPEVSEITRRRVQEAALNNHYQPNVRATGLATGKAMAIGHVIPVHNKNDVVNPVFGEFIAGASQTYSEHGYELLLTIADRDNEHEVYQSIAAKGAVDGVIVHSPQRRDDRIALLRQIGLPFVVHGRVSESDLPYSWVDMDNRTAFDQATKLLLNMGHKDIALINGPHDLNFAWLRAQGYRDALNQAGIEPDENLISHGELTEVHGFEHAFRLLSLSRAPTAFLVSSYVAAIGVRRAISRCALQIGEDVSVIVHDDELSYFDNQGEVPQFTATRSSVREAGVQAAKMLLDIIDKPEKAPLSKRLKASLIVGASTGPVDMPQQREQA